MNKKIVLALLFALLSSLSVFAAAPDKLEPLNKNTPNNAASKFDTKTVYYPNANIKSAVAKYKNGNYTGCLQELFSLVKKDPSNALAYYYMAMAFTHVDMSAEAVDAYEKVISLSPNSYLSEYATKGRDCLTGGPTCLPEGAQQAAGEQDDLDKFINAPYGNGLSEELNGEVKQKQLNNLRETINKKENLDTQDIEKMKKFDTKNDNTSLEQETEKIAMVSDEEILQAVQTLKDAGLNLTLQSENPYTQMYQDPKMAEMSMLLGNNNNNTGSMMNMMPYLISQTKKGENIDPRFVQAMMMNSMMSDFSFTNNNNNRY